MMPYIILLVAAGALGFGLCEYKPTKKKELIYAAVITAVMCAMAICRKDTVGVDYNFLYRDLFLSFDGKGFDFLLSPDNAYRTEPLFVLLNIIIGLFTDSPMVCFAVFGVLIILLRSVVIIKHCSKPWLALYLYISLGFFSYSLCTIRQELAISIAMFALPFIMNRKPLPYFAIILAAGLMHNSLLLLLPLYWVVLIPPTKKWAVGLYSAGMLVIILFSGELIDTFTSVFTRFSYYNSGDGRYFLIGRNVITVLAWCALLVLCGMFYKRIVARDPRNMILFNLYLFGTLIMVPTVKTFIFQRVALMLLPFSVMLISEIVAAFDYREIAASAADKKAVGNKRQELKKKADDDKRMYYYTIALFMFIAVIEYFMLMNANRLDLVPYVTFWM